MGECGVSTPAASAAAANLIRALKEIARGRPDNGRPLPAETARQIARLALIDAGINWTDA
jgi:hypothetical protein